MRNPGLMNPRLRGADRFANSLSGIHIHF